MNGSHLDSLVLAVPSSEGAEEDIQPAAEARPFSEKEKQQNLKDQEAERRLRRSYATRAYWFAVGGVCFWGSLLLGHGWAVLFLEKAPFSDNVLIAITTATTVHLFAAFLGVIRGLFPTGGRKPTG